MANSGQKDTQSESRFAFWAKHELSKPFRLQTFQTKGKIKQMQRQKYTEFFRISMTKTFLLRNDQSTVKRLPQCELMHGLMGT